ncbi:thioredoxin domain-containing protein, partial [Streptococcus suis]
TKACDVNREILLSLFAKTTDCFELLSPRFLRFKRQYSISLNEMIQLILQKPDQNLRLPLIVCQNHVYPAIGLDEVRTFLPRQVKEELFQASLMKQVTG